MFPSKRLQHPTDGPRARFRLGEKYIPGMVNQFKRRFTIPVINALGGRLVRKRLRDRPILIGGCARTGSSLLLSILAAHPRIVAITYETGVFLSWTEHDAPEAEGRRFQPERLDRIHRNLIARHIPRSATRWCEKTPRNVRHIEKILQHFRGEVRFIHIVRDGRDVLTSLHPEKPEEYWVTPQRWVNDTRAGLALRQEPEVCTIKYEDLVLHHQRTLKTICDFLELDVHERLRQWFEHTTIRRNRAWSGPLQDLHTDSVGKWRSPAHRDRLAEILADQAVADLLKELDYT